MRYVPGDHSKLSSRYRETKNIGDLRPCNRLASLALGMKCLQIGHMYVFLLALSALFCDMSYQVLKIGRGGNERMLERSNYRNLDHCIFKSKAQQLSAVGI